jgi:hypothetical protein
MRRPARPKGAVTELKIPAQAPFVLVAKRAAGALASCAGFGLHDIDDLNIAVAHACQKAIAGGDRLWGPGNGILKLTFRIVDGGIEVEVKSLPNRAALADDESLRREGELEREAEAMREAAVQLSREVAVEREQRRRAELAVERLAARQSDSDDMSERQREEVAVNIIRLFVDELRYNVDAHGSMRMRMVKHVVG